MFTDNTDREWEKFGATEPYFGVCAHNKYRQDNLTDEDKAAFFESGEEHIAKIMQKIRKHIDSTYIPIRALDFGCGVGRLVIPLAKVVEHVVGVDVSESMIAEAKKNCDSVSIKNVTFVKTDDNLSQLKGKYDFIHSFIVFQHIPVKRGEQIFKSLLQLLEDGGVCVIHFTYANTSKLRKIIPWIKNYVPLAKNLINLIKGRSFFSPQMQMNIYNLNKLFLLIQQQNIYDFYAEYTDHGGELGILVYFRKPKMT